MSFSARTLIAFTLFCGLFLTGCQSPPRVGEITVTVVEFQPTTLAQPRAVMTLRFINENLIPVALEGSRHKLYLNGTFVGEVENTKAVGLAPSSARTQEVPILFENPELVRRLASSPDSVVSYRLINIMEYWQSEEREYLKSETNSTVDLSPLVSP